jgi:hypothetical protein
MRKQNLVDKTFGLLTVVSQHYKPALPRTDRGGRTDNELWCFCKCACGNENLYEVRAATLNIGKCTCCGCLNYEKRAAHARNISDMNRKYDPATAAALRLYRQHYNDGDISFELWKQYCNLPCIYCSAPPSNKALSDCIGGKEKFSIEERTFIYQGLDRINSSQPHNLDNCVPSCATCNHAKNDGQIAIFLNMAISISRLNKTERPSINIPAPNIIEQHLIENNICENNRWSLPKRQFLKRTKFGGELAHRMKGYKKKGILSIEQIIWLATHNCYYCGNPPLNSIRQNNNLLGFYNGLDRVDSSIRTYMPNNTVPSCIICNIAKRDRSINDFLAWADRVNQQIKTNSLLQYFLTENNRHIIGSTTKGVFLQQPSELIERIIWNNKIY